MAAVLRQPDPGGVEWSPDHDDDPRQSCWWSPDELLPFCQLRPQTSVDILDKAERGEAAPTAPLVVVDDAVHDASEDDVFTVGADQLERGESPAPPRPISRPVDGLTAEPVSALVACEGDEGEAALARLRACRDAIRAFEERHREADALAELAEALALPAHARRGRPPRPLLKTKRALRSLTRGLWHRWLVRRIASGAQ